MINLDLKDRKILYQLDINCRQSNAQIGRKVGLSKQVVDYRIKRMEDDGIITGYWADVDSFKLGFNIFRIYINFQNASSSVKKEIIEYFCNYKNIYIVASVQGAINFVNVIWNKNAFEFWNFWNETLDLYQEYFEKAIISLYIQLRVYKNSYLIENYEDSLDRELYRINCGAEPVNIDIVDYLILQHLITNARISLIELGNELGYSSQSIKYKIDNLKKKGIIMGFKVAINFSKLNLRNYKIDIVLKVHKYRKKIIDYISKQPYIHELNEAIGWADIEPEVIVENPDKLIEIMEDINLKFPGAIKKQSYFLVTKEHKCNTLPKMSEVDFKKI